METQYSCHFSLLVFRFFCHFIVSLQVEKGRDIRDSGTRWYVDMFVSMYSFIQQICLEYLVGPDTVRIQGSPFLLETL